MTTDSEYILVYLCDKCLGLGACVDLNITQNVREIYFFKYHEIKKQR